MPCATDSKPAINYRVEVLNLHAHLFHITLTVAHPSAGQLVSLPVWIPGSYLVREFSKNLQALRAAQNGSAIRLEQLNKSHWRAECTEGAALTITYEVCAYDASVRTAWLDASRGFFNGTSLCLRVHGQEQAPHILEIMQTPAIAHWSVATGLTPEAVNEAGFGIYLASNYDELVDCPVEMGTFWSGQFTAAAIPHRFVVAGAAPSFDGQRLLEDTQKICEAAIQLWGGKPHAPHADYLFMLNAVDEGYGGLEHRNSTALICNRRHLPRIGDTQASEGYTTLLGLISHEYFHTWNVKRLRPAEFERYDYTQENYTQLLWFFEGFTSYYDDLLLRRAGLLDNDSYLKLLAKTINQVLQTPGRALQSVAEASFDAWVKYYRQDENTPNATVSYYTKGALVALCLDLTLRQDGKTSLDHVMRALWQRCNAGPMSEGDLLSVLEELSGRSMAQELADWVHGTADLPLERLLAAHGVTMQTEPPQPAQRLGLRVKEGASIMVQSVLRGSPAESAGMSAGDEWLGLELAGEGWRINRLEDLALIAGPNRQVTALVARGGRLLRLPLELPESGAALGATTGTAVLSVCDAAALNHWLNPE